MSGESEKLDVRNGSHFPRIWELFSQQSSGAIPCTRLWKAQTFWKASCHGVLLDACCVLGTRIEQ